MLNIKSFHRFHSDKFYNDEELAKLYFDEPALQQAKEHHYEILCYMPVNDFLAVANDGYDTKKHARVAGLIHSGHRFNEIPYIIFTHDNNGNATVVGHEGRHRARFLHSLGIEKMPVIMKSYSAGEGSYAINKENIENQPPYFDEEFPTVLKGELNNSKNKVPFPITL